MYWYSYLVLFLEWYGSQPLLNLVDLKRTTRLPLHFTLLVKPFIEPSKNCFNYKMDGIVAVYRRVSRDWYEVTFVYRYVSENVFTNNLEINVIRV